MAYSSANDALLAASVTGQQSLKLIDKSEHDTYLKKLQDENERWKTLSNEIEDLQNKIKKAAAEDRAALQEQQAKNKKEQLELLQTMEQAAIDQAYKISQYRQYTNQQEIEAYTKLRDEADKKLYENKIEQERIIAEQAKKLGGPKEGQSKQDWIKEITKDSDEYKALIKEQGNLSQQETLAKNEVKAREQAEKKVNYSLSNFADRIKLNDEKYKTAEEKAQKTRKEYLVKQQLLNKKKQDGEEVSIEEEQDLANKRKEMLAAESEKSSLSFTTALGDIASTLKSSFTKMLSSMTDEIDTIMDSLIEEAADFNTRLQNSTTAEDYYTPIIRDVQKNLGLSSLVSQKEYVENIQTLVDTGTNYNIEQRAFLETISDKIATTFNAFDSNLLKIIRLQQDDSTAERLGMEAQLTQFFNANFSDTSYLGGDNGGGTYDTVTQNLTQAISQMNKDQAIGFEFTIQKWLGSLSAMGFSDNAISSISKALSDLSSGDISSLTSNSTTLNLLEIAASNAGLDFAKILQNGLETDTTNTLLKEMVSYLKEIASGDNLVVKNALGEVFGMEMSDFRALENLTASEINTIYNYMNTDSSTISSRALAETNYQILNNVAKRTPISQAIDTLSSNLTFDAAYGLLFPEGGYTTAADLNMSGLFGSFKESFSDVDLISLDLSTLVAKFTSGLANSPINYLLWQLNEDVLKDLAGSAILGVDLELISDIASLGLTAVGLSNGLNNITGVDMLEAITQLAGDIGTPVSLITNLLNGGISESIGNLSSGFGTIFAKMSNPGNVLATYLSSVNEYNERGASYVGITGGSLEDVSYSGNFMTPDTTTQTTTFTSASKTEETLTKYEETMTTSVSNITDNGIKISNVSELANELAFTLKSNINL